MTNRHITQLIRAHEVTEGAGVTVHRTLGTPARPHLDPFLMLDHISSDDPDDYLAGFPEHPHRGFNTFTYMLEGHMRHGDSMGNQGDLGPGGAQWMKAASGVIHSEMPQQVGGAMRGFQLWINLPAQEKMSAPTYQEIHPESVPEIIQGEQRIRVLAGSYLEQRGPVTDSHTQAQILDVTLLQGTVFTHRLAHDHNAMLYVFEGCAQLADNEIPLHHLAILSAGDELVVSAGPEGARLLVVAGRPLGEPIVQYGPFVMNSREEIEQAMADYRDGRLVRSKASMVLG